MAGGASVNVSNPVFETRDVFEGEGVKRVAIDLSGLLEKVSEAIAVFDEHGRIVFANDALSQLMGEPDGPASWPAWETGPLAIPDDLPVGQVRQVVREGGSGRTPWLTVLYIPLSDSAGARIGVLAHAFKGRAPQEIQRAQDTLVAEQIASFRERERSRWGWAAVPARSPAMARTLRQIRLAIGSLETVTLIGEIGAGKLGLARVLHHRSPDRTGPLLVLDCRALPRESAREHLLGTFEKPGGIRGGNVGALRMPEAGTLVLRSSSSLPTDLQQEVAKALRREDRPWRLLATERRPLEESWSEGLLVEDLYYLLSTFRIEMPPLRERREDLADCAAIALDRLSRERDQAGTIDEVVSTPALAPEALELLARYDWPGNLRELETVLRQAMQRARGRAIVASDLPKRVRAEREEPIADEPEKPIAMDTVLEEVERRLLRLALVRAKGNKSKAAEFLSISRARFNRRVEQLGLE